MKNIFNLMLLLTIVLVNLIVSTSAMAKNLSNDTLPSWNEGTNKQTIIKFVEAVTNPKSPNYVAPELRIATFDNDGTLWTEKPMYFQAAFIISRLIKLSPEHPEWENQQPFKAVLENDEQYLAN